MTHQIVSYKPMGRLVRQGFPLLVASVLAVIWFTSAVPPNLLVVSGRFASGIMVVYFVFVLWLSLDRAQTAWPHRIGAPIAALVFFGRGGGFVELSFELGNWNLAGAVAERALLAVCLVIWHVYMSHQVTAEKVSLNDFD
mgnify:CR=1 FL=1